MVSCGFALGLPSGDVGAGAWVPGHPCHGEDVEGVVGLSVAAAVEPVAVGLARGGRERRHPAEVSEGGFVAHPIGVVTDRHQQRGAGLRPQAFTASSCGAVW
jgi:hypothetical protein